MDQCIAPRKRGRKEVEFKRSQWRRGPERWGTRSGEGSHEDNKKRNIQREEERETRKLRILRQLKFVMMGRQQAGRYTHGSTYTRCAQRQNDRQRDKENVRLNSCFYLSVKATGTYLWRNESHSSRKDRVVATPCVSEPQCSSPQFLES